MFEWLHCKRRLLDYQSTATLTLLISKTSVTLVICSWDKSLRVSYQTRSVRSFTRPKWPNESGRTACDAMLQARSQRNESSVTADRYRFRSFLLGTALLLRGIDRRYFLPVIGLNLYVLGFSREITPGYGICLQGTTPPASRLIQYPA